jgi:hypothetical protein
MGDHVPGPMPDPDTGAGEVVYVLDTRQLVDPVKTAEEAAEAKRRDLVDALLEERTAHPERADQIDAELVRLRAG